MVNKAITDEINQVMENALLKLRDLVNSDLSQQPNFLSIANVFLLGVISTTADLVELSVQTVRHCCMRTLKLPLNQGATRHPKETIHLWP